jgi:hypothetical protein
VIFGHGNVDGGLADTAKAIDGLVVTQ